MSRAFVKEDRSDKEPAQTPVRRARAHPYYVTPDGLKDLRRQLALAAQHENEREVADLQERIEAAVVVDPAQQPHDAVHFGARVTVEDSQRKRNAYRIVGEDEADPAHGTISWLSPLAQALLEHRTGERVIWQRPAGALPLRIVSIEY